MRRSPIALAALIACLFVLPATQATAALPPIKHVWIVVLENENYDTTFGPNSKAPYLAKTLTSQGQLLTQYYGIGHFSLDNYIAMVSGQPPNAQTQADCPFFNEFAGAVGPDGIAVGQGCVYPTAVKTIADQLESKGLNWKGYMEDMGTGCRHPALNQHDDTQTARANDQYAGRHNPFIYFHSIIDRPICNTNDVDLSKLQGDLASTSTAPSYSFITPDLCSDGHDAPCADGRPGGLVSVNDFLKTWIPRITGSPAYADGGLVIVNFDESGSGAEDCCGEPTGPNTPNNGGLTQGNGGGRTGAVLLSPYIKAGSVNDTPYNHYSLLRSTEDIFGLSHLGYAANTGLKPFEEDVFNNPKGDTKFNPGGGSGGTTKPGPRPKVTLTGVPDECVRRAFTARVKIRSNQLRNVHVLLDRNRIAQRNSKSFSVRVGIRGLRRGNHHLAVRARDASRRTTLKSDVFRICGDD
ncbi:MAG: phosphatidylinositol-3-phosphatase [Thermoleophilaceae bacterium]|nr:phosphatidylinositol-3-phosphatase [Thermoleophilaceae bacterium]